MSGCQDLRTAVLDAGRGHAHYQHRLVVLAAAFDDSGGWAFDGARSCAHWLADALEVEVCTAREWLRIGHALGRLTVLEERFAAGRLSYAKIRTLSRVATETNQAELCELAERVPAGGLAAAVAAWLARRETPDQTEARHRQARRLNWRLDPDGMITGRFRLPPADAAKLIASVDAKVAVTHRGRDTSADAHSPQPVSEWPTLAQQRADALIDLISGGASIDTEIVLHVRGDGCSLDDGTPIPGTIVERLIPHAFLRVLIHDAQSRPINASGRHRHPTTRQRRVVKERDRRCVDCGSPYLLHYDHQPAYHTTGHTHIDELRLRCATCHRKRHANSPT